MIPFPWQVWHSFVFMVGSSLLSDRFAQVDGSADTPVVFEAADVVDLVGEFADGLGS
jgi:hypothetical protein